MSQKRKTIENRLKLVQTLQETTKERIKEAQASIDCDFILDAILSISGDTADETTTSPRRKKRRNPSPKCFR